MALSETVKKSLILDLHDNIDYTYEGWDPSLKIWRAGESGSRTLPYMTVDFVSTQDKKFPSLGDIVGRINDLRYEYAYCEIELVSVTIYANKYHYSNTIRGRDFAHASLVKVRKRILAYWNDILRDYNSSIDRGMATPIRDLSSFNDDVGTRIHEYELNVFLRTDVRWYKDMPSEGDDIEERAEKAYIVMNDVNNIRIDTS